MAGSGKEVVVFLDIGLGSRAIGRLVFELFYDVTPRTAENFRCLCTGERGVSARSNQRLHYAGSTFHRVIAGFMAQGGDFTRGNGTGGESIYGTTFDDEDFTRRHDEPGLLSMANSGPGTNGSQVRVLLRHLPLSAALRLPTLPRCSPPPPRPQCDSHLPPTACAQFFVTFAKTPHLDGKHVVFGRLVRGHEVLHAVKNVATKTDDTPRLPVTIVHCGQLGVATAEPVDAEGEATPATAAASSSSSSSSARAASASSAPAANPYLRAAPAAEIAAPGEDAAASAEAVAAAAAAAAETVPAHLTGRARKLFELRLRMNKGRKLNKKAVVDEYRRDAKAKGLKNPWATGRKKGGKLKKIGEVDAKAQGGKGKKEETVQKKRERRVEGGAEGEVEKGDGSSSSAAIAAAGDDGQVALVKRDEEDWFMDETAERASKRQKKSDAKAAKSAAFGWDVFNSDAMKKAHDKRVLRLAKTGVGSRSAASADAARNAAAAGELHIAEQIRSAPAPAAIDRMVAELDEGAKRRQKVRASLSLSLSLSLSPHLPADSVRRAERSAAMPARPPPRRAARAALTPSSLHARAALFFFFSSFQFSRERRTNPDEDPFHINERNRVFNKKVSRSFDKYTIEIRQNLERGSAL